MSLISLASAKSVWRGYEYFEEKRVHYHMQCGELEYNGKVSGNGKSYDVHIDLKHPRKSACNCPHADGRRIICKHMIALYFNIFPSEAESYTAEVEAYEEELEDYAIEMDRKIVDSINSMSKQELCEALYELLCDAPEWLVDRFVYEYVD